MSPSRRRIAALICALALVSTGCSELVDQFRNLPELDEKDIDPYLAQSSFIYAGDGSLITSLHGTENRTLAPLRKIPKDLQNAVVAIEDERFYEHDGVDFKAIVRAMVANVSSGTIEEGGSTITQQYVKNVIIAPKGQAEKTVERKIDEAAYARQLEDMRTKKEILELYLNTVYFGQGAYGVKAAARTFFHKSLSELKVHEAAMLAGLIRAPENYDPVDHPKVGKTRRNLVLAKMAELGYISETKMRAAQQKKIAVFGTARRDRYPAPYFVDYVRRLIKYDPRFADALEGRADSARDREQLLLTGGLKVYTTIDLEEQAQAEAAVNGILTEKQDPYGALVAIDPDNGHIRAMVGGRNWFAPRKVDKFNKLNLAVANEPDLDAKKAGGTAPGFGRQAGSAFKTFALAAAIENGIPLSKSYEGTSPKTFPGQNNGEDWIVRNYEGGSFGKIALMEATASSVNVVYAQLILELGPEVVTELAREMGIRTPLLPVPSAVLGANEVNALGMASAYATLAADGVYHRPVAIERIEDAEGNVIYQDPRGQGQEVLDPSVAYLTTSALEGVIDAGTGVAAQLDGRDVAGKTGTAQEYRDAWFAGYTPDLAAAVWVGHPQGQVEMQSCSTTHEVQGGKRVEVCRAPRIGAVTGGSWPAQIWQAFMIEALADVPPTEFVEPDGIVSVEIDTRGDNCLAGPGTPDEFRVYTPFPAGAEPTRVCKIARKIEVPDVVGLPEDSATRILEDDGFGVNVVDEPTTEVPPGNVVYQTPDGGENATSGSTVTIGVSTATPDNAGPEGTVPGVLGLSREGAEDVINDNGFRVEVVIQPESSRGQAKKNRGRVWKQSPNSGTVRPQGSTVTIWVNPS